jgi:hypothetical protein
VNRSQVCIWQRKPDLFLLFVHFFASAVRRDPTESRADFTNEAHSGAKFESKKSHKFVSKKCLARARAGRPAPRTGLREGERHSTGEQVQQGIDTRTLLEIRGEKPPVTQATGLRLAACTALTSGL